MTKLAKLQKKKLARVGISGKCTISEFYVFLSR